MDANENANLIEGLRAINFTDRQINDLILMVSGHISIDEWAKRYRENKN